MPRLKEIIKIDKKSKQSIADQITYQIIDLINNNQYPKDDNMILDDLNILADCMDTTTTNACRIRNELLRRKYIRLINIGNKTYIAIDNRQTAIENLENAIRIAIFTHNISVEDIMNILEHVAMNRKE